MMPTTRQLGQAIIPQFKKPDNVAVAELPDPADCRTLLTWEVNLQLDD